jgi:hypothetical protein
MRGLITANAARLRELHDELHRAFREHPHGPAHQAACHAFRSNYDQLAFPGGLEAGLVRLKALEPDAVEIAIRFLEADPWFFRSGYIKEEIIRRLKHAPLTTAQRASLRAVVIRSVVVERTGLPRRLATLAPVVDSPEFRKEIETVAESSDRRIQLRAKQVLHNLRSARK